MNTFQAFCVVVVLALVAMMAYKVLYRQKHNKCIDCMNGEQSGMDWSAAVQQRDEEVMRAPDDESDLSSEDDKD